MVNGLIFILLLAGSVLIWHGSMRAKTSENKILFLLMPIIFYPVMMAFVIPVAARIAPVADDMSFVSALMSHVMVVIFMIILICLVTLPKLIEGFMTKHPYLIAASFLPISWLVSYFTAKFGFDMSTPVWYMTWAIVLFIMGRKAIRFVIGKGNEQVDKEGDKQEEGA